MKEVLIVSSKLSFSCFVILKLDTAHIPPLPANLMLGFSNRGCWRDTARGILPLPSSWFVVFLMAPGGQHPWHVISTHSSEVRISTGLAIPPLSSFLIPPVQSEWYLLSAVAAKPALTTNQHYLNPPTPQVTRVASES